LQTGKNSSPIHTGNENETQNLAFDASFLSSRETVSADRASRFAIHADIMTTAGAAAEIAKRRHLSPGRSWR
jgi:hypothetical protein